MLSAPIVPVWAASISWDLVPSAVTVFQGQSVTADVVISGKAVGSAPSIGAIDFDVTFDPTILSPTNVTFGPFLGNPGLFEALTDFKFLPGVVDFAEASLLSPAQLDTVQPASFSIATLSFKRWFTQGRHRATGCVRFTALRLTPRCLIGSTQSFFTASLPIETRSWRR